MCRWCCCTVQVCCLALGGSPGTMNVAPGLMTRDHCLHRAACAKAAFRRIAKLKKSPYASALKQLIFQRLNCLTSVMKGCADKAGHIIFDVSREILWGDYINCRIFCNDFVSATNQQVPNATTTHVMCSSISLVDAQCCFVQQAYWTPGTQTEQHYVSLVYRLRSKHADLRSTADFIFHNNAVLAAQNCACVDLATILCSVGMICSYLYHCHASLMYIHF